MEVVIDDLFKYVLLLFFCLLYTLNHLVRPQDHHRTTHGETFYAFKNQKFVFILNQAFFHLCHPSFFIPSQTRPDSS